MNIQILSARIGYLHLDIVCRIVLSYAFERANLVCDRPVRDTVTIESPGG